MSGDIAISAALRANLTSLKSVDDNISKITNILSTGREVNSALDDPVRFFAAQSLTNRADDLNGTLDAIGQSISIIQQATEANNRLQDLITQAQSIANQARETLSSGAFEAKVTGNVDLSDVDDIVGDLTGVDCGDTIRFSVSDPTGLQQPVVFDDGSASGALGITVSVNSGDSIEQFIADINAIEDVNGDQIIEASLNSDGGLEIRALNGGNLRLEFFDAGDNASSTTDPTSSSPSDVDFAEALGLDVIGFEGQANAGATADTTLASITATAGPQLTSLALFDSSDNDNIAVRTSTLNNLIDDNGNDFGFSGGAGSNLNISINGEDAVQLDLGGDFNPATVTIQDFIDAINTDAELGDQLQASFDDDTGQIVIRSLDASVQTVQFQFEANGSQTGGRLFGFGVSTASFSTAQGFSQAAARTPFATGSGNITTRTFQFGAGATELLAQEISFDKIRQQIDELVENDADYAGTNLLNGDNLETFFNADRTSSLTTFGATFTSSGLGIEEADFGRSETVEAAINSVRAALETSRAFGSTLATDLGVVQTRETFTENTINNLEAGADKLTLADENEQGVQLLALQTRQQLSVTSLSLAAQSQQNVLRLF